MAPPPGSHVMVRPQRRDRWIDGTGLVIGPDQRYFPCPTAVFVAFPTGMTTLIDVADLMLVTPSAGRVHGDDRTPPPPQTGAMRSAVVCPQDAGTAGHAGPGDQR
ncbi:MAG: hypothetical protein ACRDTC_20055 [Pseudonocardiaceae bacterium]